LNRTKSAVVSASAPRRNTPVSMSTGLDAAPMPRVSKTEFQNLPSSVQQKVSPYSIFLAYRKSSQPTSSLQDIVPALHPSSSTRSAAPLRSEQSMSHKTGRELCWSHAAFWDLTLVSMTEAVEAPAPCHRGRVHLEPRGTLLV
jgi:hypothetical protein